MAGKNKTDGRGAAALSDVETAAFCSQTAMLLSGGMILEELTAQLCAIPDESSPALTAAYNAVNEGVAQGMTLCAALRDAGVFPRYMISVVEVSERSGRLAPSLSALARYYSSRAEMSEHVRAAVIYPLGLFSMMSAVMWVMALCVFPMLSSVLGSLGANLGIADRLSAPVAAGRVLGIAAAALLTLCAVLLAISLIMLSSPKGKASLGAVIAKLGLFRSIREDSETGAFAYSISQLLASGCQASEAADIVAEAFKTSPATSALCARFQSMCDEGKPAAQSLIEMRVITGTDAHLLLTAEKSGDMAGLLSELAMKRQSRAQENTDAAVAAAEPISAAAVSATMGLILLSILLPAAAVMNVIG